ncbi:MAG: sugar phosphate isomerase/epimerase [Pirellulaceae bacterium]|nr:sugar phosphate isomerase/epimerase [Pirellulaceae bacterium]MCH2131681.1 sugar phosphate isomerase/epimerase [Pirellulaceae bacterium]
MTTSLSRRHFLQVSSAAAAGATFFDIPSIVKAADDPFGGYPIGVQTYSLRNFNTLETIRHLQGMGLHYCEMYDKHLNLNATPAQIDETKKLLAAADITLNAHGVSGFSKNHDANRKVFEFAKRAGIKNITAYPEPDSFESLDKLVAEFDIRIAIHNHGPTDKFYDKIKDVADAIKDHHPLIGACVDTGHFIRSAEDPVQAVLELSDRVFALHLKDDTHKGDPGSHNVVLGEANLDVVGIFKALKTIDFPADGSVSLEYEANPDNPIDAMKQCLVVAQQAIAKAAG